MRTGGGKAVVAGAALGAHLLVAAASGQPPGSVPPVFTQRLQIPVRGDDLELPRAVVADPHSGEVMVCDTRRNRIVIFDPEGRFRHQIPGGSTFQSPVDLAVDPEGLLFVLSQVSPDISLLDFDGRLLRRISLSGVPESVHSPRLVSLAISPTGDRLYLVDSENDRLWITDREGVIRDSVDLTEGRPQKEIDELRYGHVDVYGGTVLLPIPTDGLVHLFDLAGRSRGTVGSPGSAECQTRFPAAAALDDEGRVIILDQQRAMFMTWDLERGVCLTEHYGFGNAPGAFYQPNDLALDRTGRLYVSQGFEGRVQVYEGASPAPTRESAAAPAEPPIADVAAVEAEAVQQPPPVEEPTVAAAEAEARDETAELAEVEQTVRAWAAAWAGKRIEEYLGFYSDDFDTGRELTRSEWEELRRLRLDRPRSIEVSLAQIEPQVTEDRAQAAFVQTYRSDLFADKVDKILVLVREETGWKILSERVVRIYHE
jgi:sugar lactone lactonase YvrE